ncbi:hypothetical protein [Flavobacterium sp.]|uniref:hypothetical protein n=1 Tax=Flavobacterium sp. TaxID=239 RepID=UPI003BC89FB4
MFYNILNCFLKASISPIEGTAIAKLCDYSFGDQASVLSNIPGAKMRLANLGNIEFKLVLSRIMKNRNYMTVFIDNIRLYNRDILVDEVNRGWIRKLMAENDLLKLCSNYKNMNFIIFSNLEDTSIDIEIEGKIPSNVLGIFAANAVYNSEKVFPFPYGIQRRMWFGDIRKELLLSKMHIEAQPSKLLYINHSVHTNVAARSGIKELFYNKPWATVIDARINYPKFLSDIKNHKFVICPIGNAIDCHRNWEVLYMRRVPVMIKNDYLQKLFKDLPVLFVDSYSDISEVFLSKNDNLYRQALAFDMKSLDLKVMFFQQIDNCLNKTFID